MCLTSIFRKVPLFPSLILMPFHHQEEKAKISAFQSKIISITCCSKLLQGLRQCYVSLWRIWKSLSVRKCLSSTRYSISVGSHGCGWRSSWVPYPLSLPSLHIVPGWVPSCIDSLVCSAPPSTPSMSSLPSVVAAMSPGAYCLLCLWLNWFSARSW